LPTLGRTGRASIVAIVLALCGGIAAALPGQGSAPRTVTLSIVGTNDLHGGIMPRGGRGGLARLAGYVDNLRAARARDGGAVLLVDAGDMFQGTLESNMAEGAPVVAAYNVIGYTAAAIGNHDFDYGPVGPAPTPRAPGDDARGALKARAAEAAFPFLAANLLDRATGRPVDWPNVRPSTLVDAVGVKVGILGVITRDALEQTISANTVGLAVAPLAPAIEAEASRLRSEGAVVVIVAAHAGGRCTVLTRPADPSSCDRSSEIVEVLRRLPVRLVDVVVAGHVHAAMAHEIQSVPVIESYFGGRSFGRVDVTVDREAKRVTGRRIFPPRDLIAGSYEGATVVASEKVAAVLAPAVERVEAMKAMPLGVTLATPVRRAGRESPLGNLFTDALLGSVPDADVAMNNTFGGLRADLPAGPLTYGSLYEVFPFDNRIVILDLSGRELRQVLTAQLLGNGGLVGVSGIRVTAACAGTTLGVTLTRPSGAALRDDEVVRVVTTDFLATGGDRIFAPIMPPQGFTYSDDEPVARDLVADWLRRRGGTIREGELVDLERPRWSYPGSLPVRCSRR
jgi:5'-nucleotidase